MFEKNSTYHCELTGSWFRIELKQHKAETNENYSAFKLQNEWKLTDHLNMNHLTSTTSSISQSAVKYG